MNADLDAFATELYVTVDDMLIANPGLAPARPEVGIEPLLSDSELITLSVIQSLLGYNNEAKFIRSLSRTYVTSSRTCQNDLLTTSVYVVQQAHCRA